MPEKETNNESTPKYEDNISITHHAVTIAGREIRYTATTGTMILKEENDEPANENGEPELEKPKAAIFFTAYTLDADNAIDGAEHRKTRPLTFSFNGGPGSSSVWLHMGLLGPRRVKMTDEGEMPPPPFELVDNEFSLLDLTDLVFIDPVTTGYSRAIPGESPKQYHDFQKDIQSVGDFIRLFTSRYQRWVSPKFLIGESYGTTRAAGLAGYLQERHGMYLNGIMLISSILNFQTARFVPGNDMPYILFLPTYTATAWYHGKLDDELQKNLRDTLDEVEAFALGEYASALMKGDALPSGEKDKIIQKLARYTGLTSEYIEQTNLRVEIMRFTKGLQRDERRTTGRLDTRFKGIDRDAAGESWEFDPSLAAITGPYTATLNDYVRSELNFESDLPYEILTSRVHPWSYDQHQNQYVNVAETLRKAMSINRYMKVFVANGYYDLATPYFATLYTFDHMDLDESLRDNITMDFYEAGHMMYIHLPSLEKLKSDLAEFVRSALPE
ncbi:MAG: peptidase S10 [Anaerolineales bacterium]|nr:peptidase S10 [Chloroflexota bacterium]MBL6980838.1 peptidase S10 [Anaerolineales bacterium]